MIGARAGARGGAARGSAAITAVRSPWPVHPNPPTAIWPVDDSVPTVRPAGRHQLLGWEQADPDVGTACAAPGVAWVRRWADRYETAMAEAAALNYSVADAPYATSATLLAAAPQGTHDAASWPTA